MSDPYAHVEAMIQRLRELIREDQRRFIRDYGYDPLEPSNESLHSDPLAPDSVTPQ